MHDFRMGTEHLHFSNFPPRVRPRDRKVLFAVRFADGSSEYIRVEPQTAAFGPLRVTKDFLPFIPSGGRVIMISSGGGSMTDEVGGWWPAYCVSKSLLNAITRHLAYELSEKNISVNAVCPGWVKTEMGGRGAPRSVERGAETITWLATEAPLKLTGKFFRDRKEIPW